MPWLHIFHGITQKEFMVQLAILVQMNMRAYMNLKNAQNRPPTLTDCLENGVYAEPTERNSKICINLIPSVFEHTIFKTTSQGQAAFGGG